VRDNTSRDISDRDGARDIDRRRFAAEGVELYGLLNGLEGTLLKFGPDLRTSLDHADEVYSGINASIDEYIERNIYRRAPFEDPPARAQPAFHREHVLRNACRMRKPDCPLNSCSWRDDSTAGDVPDARSDSPVGRIFALKRGLQQSSLHPLDDGHVGHSTTFAHRL
jgi:hypothetical protein